MIIFKSNSIHISRCLNVFCYILGNFKSLFLVLKRVIFSCSSSHYYPPPVAPSYGGVGGIGGIGGGIGGGGFRGGYGYHGYYGYSDGGYGGYPTTYYGYIPYGMIIQSVFSRKTCSFLL
jgi:hypothetical protein